eukprot:3956608-Pyramimonas_sp.AAC.1
MPSGGKTARAADSAVEAEVATGVAKAKAKASGKRSHSGGAPATRKAAKAAQQAADADGEENPDDVAAAKLQETLKKLKMTRTKLSQASSACSDLLIAVASQPKWQWANNEFQLKQVRDSRDALEKKKVMSSFWNDFTLDDDFFKTLAKKYDSATIEVELQRKGEMESAIRALSNEVGILKDMHAARLKRDDESQA